MIPLRFEDTIEAQLGWTEGRMRALLEWLSGTVKADSSPVRIMAEIEASGFSVQEKVYLGLRLGFLIQESGLRQRGGLVVDGGLAEKPRAS